MMGARFSPRRRSAFLDSADCFPEPVVISSDGARKNDGPLANLFASMIVLWQTTTEVDLTIFPSPALGVAAVGTGFGRRNPCCGDTRQDAHFRRESAR